MERVFPPSRSAETGPFPSDERAFTPRMDDKNQPEQKRKHITKKNWTKGRTLSPLFSKITEESRLLYRKTEHTTLTKVYHALIPEKAYLSWISTHLYH
jgi:hypothetical protein